MWKQPCDFRVFTTDVRGHTLGCTSMQINTLTRISEGSGAKRTSISSDRRVSEAAERMQNEAGSQAGSFALQTCFSNHTARRQTDRMFLHETAIS